MPRTVVAKLLVIREEIYGTYNRKLEAWTDEGLLVGIVKEEDCQGLEVGTHKNVGVSLYESFSGTRLVAGIVLA